MGVVIKGKGDTGVTKTAGIKKVYAAQQVSDANDIEAKAGVGKVEQQFKDGSVVETTEQVMEPEMFDQPTANVGLSVGVTRNLGNYESVRFTVSLFCPCRPTPEEIEHTFEEVRGWVDNKINQINSEV